MDNNPKMPKVGDEVIVEYVGNAKRWNNEDFTTAIVNKVGRKYFYLDGFRREKFGYSGYGIRPINVSNYSPDYRVYFSQQEYNEHKERKALWKQFDDEVSSLLHDTKRTVSLEDIRDVVAVLRRINGKEESDVQSKD